MSILTTAIEQKLHICDDDSIMNQTWEQFRTDAKQKNIWIYGVDKLASDFFSKYGTEFQISGACDNDSRKHNQKLNEICCTSAESEVLINNTDILAELDKEKTVIMVMSTRYYKEIIEKLRKLGYTSVYSYLHLESNSDSLANDVEREFVEECLKEPVSKNKVFVEAGAYGGHGAQITHQLLNLEINLDIVWMIDSENEKVPPNVRTVYANNWKQCAYEMETSYIWIIGNIIPEYIIKRDEQIYIMVKHWSSITLKAFYCDLHKYMEIPSVRKKYEHNNRAIDYIFVGSKFDEKSCRSGFQFKGDCIYVGSPRSDILFEEGIKKRVCDYYDISEDKHIALYAPTFRSKNQDAVVGGMIDINLDFHMLSETLTSIFGGEWVIMVRFHPYVAMQSTDIVSSECINASFYSDSQELIASSDILITDYSSIMFEATYIHKPVLLYSPDKDDYVNNERELLIEYDDLPFPKALTSSELMQNIQDFNQDAYNKKVEEFLFSYGVHEDGYASKRAAKFICKLIGENYENRM